MILLSDYLGRFKDSPEITDDFIKNANILISKVSEVLSRFGEDRQITSGFRPQDYNKQIGGSPNSSHCYCMAVDLADPDKRLGEFCKTNFQMLVELGLYMESLDFTHKSAQPSGRWTHLTTRRPKSGSTIFIP